MDDDYSLFLEIYKKNIYDSKLDEILEKYKEIKLLNFLVYSDIDDDDCGRYCITNYMFCKSVKEEKNCNNTFDYYWLDRLYTKYEINPIDIITSFNYMEDAEERDTMYKVLEYSIGYMVPMKPEELWNEVRDMKTLEIMIKKRVCPVFHENFKYEDALDYCLSFLLDKLPNKYNKKFFEKLIDYLVCWETGKYKNIGYNNINRKKILNREKNNWLQCNILDQILSIRTHKTKINKIWDIIIMFLELGADVNLIARDLHKYDNIIWDNYFILLYKFDLDLTKIKRKKECKRFNYHIGLLRKYFDKWARYPQYRRNLSVIETIPFVPAVGTEAKSAKDHYETLNN